MNVGGNIFIVVDGGLDWVGDIGVILVINGFEVIGVINIVFGLFFGWDLVIGIDI